MENTNLLDIRQLLKENKYKHCLEVQKIVSQIGRKLQLANRGVPIDVLDRCGLWHDIGYIVQAQNHGYYGYKILSSGEYNLEALVSLFHSNSEDFVDIKNTEMKAIYTLNKIHLSEGCTTLIDIVSFADMRVNSKGDVVSFQDRLEDIKRRYGEKSQQAISAAATIERVKYLENIWKTCLEGETVCN